MRSTWLSPHLLVALTAAALAASAAGALCRNVSVPVALAAGQAAKRGRGDVAKPERGPLRGACG